MRTTEGTPLERALGLEIQAEAKRKGLSHKAIQDLTGINDKTFRRYFVVGERHIPFEALEQVADALRTPVSELVGRAEANVPLLAEAATDAKYQALLRDRSLTAAERADLRRAVEGDSPGGPPSDGSPSRIARTGTRT